jgi:tetratricopeptide (TPR) repeat protein
MKASLELLRGRPARAVAGFEQLLASADAQHMVSHYADMTLYAKSLSAAGRHSDAKRACEQALASIGPQEGLYLKKGLYQQIALIDAAQGNVESAVRILDDLLEQLKPFNNPLWSGLVHRDRAKVALVARDQAAFEQHAQAMATLFAQTKNPALIQQCDQLQAAAKAQARGARSTRALDETALAFESSQTNMCTVDDMDRFETEALPSSPPANDQVA